MNEGEPLLGSAAGKPVEGSTETGLRGALRNGEVVERARVPVEIIVQLEASIQTETGVESEGAHERGGAIAPFAKNVGQSLFPGRETERAIIANTVGDGIRRGEERGMRRKRDGNVRDGVLEDDRRVAECIDTRGSVAGAVEPEMIRAQCVD